jgi:hypothetical protein
LQAAFESTEQEGDEHGKSENPLSGEGFIVRAMCGDKFGVVQCFGKMVDNCGMDVAKRFSYFILLFQYVTLKYYTMKSLT